MQQNPSNFINSSALSPYLLTSVAATTYQAVGSYLTSFTETDPVWLGDKPNYLTSAIAATTYSLLGHTHTFASISSKPTTLLGYGITDAYPLTGNPSGFLTSFTESDPVYTGSSWYSTTNNHTNWDTAFGWGNHATPGYLVSSALIPYLTSATAGATYQPLGSYYLSSNPSGYITSTTLSGYLLSSTAASTYQPIGAYLTGITSSQIITALTYTPYNATNPSGYITSSSLSGLAIDSAVVHITGTETITGAKTFSSIISGTSSVAGATLLNLANTTSGSNNTYTFAVNSGKVLTISGGGSSLDAVLIGGLSIPNNTNPNSGSVGIGTTTPSTARLVIADTTLAGSGALAGGVLDMTQTWNTTGNPTGIKLNITNTASGTSANLLSLLVGGVYQFNIRKDGATTIGPTVATAMVAIQAISGVVPLNVRDQNSNTILSTVTNGVVFPAFAAFGAYSVTATSRVVITDSTLAGSAALAGSLLDLTQTWNTTGAPTALKLNVINTASGSTSKLIDLQVGGVSQFNIAGTGVATFGYTLQSVNFSTVGNAANTTGTAFGIQSLNNFAPTSGTGVHNAFSYTGTINQTGGANGITRGLYINPTVTAAADFRAIEVTTGKSVFGPTPSVAGFVNIKPTSGIAPLLIWDTNSNYCLVTGTSFVGLPALNVSIGTTTQTTTSRLVLTDAQLAASGALTGTLLDMSQTWNTTGSPTAIKLNVTNTASATASYLIDLQVGGVSQFKVDKIGGLTAGSVTSNGSIASNGSYTLPGTGNIVYSARTVLNSPSDGILKLTNNALTDFARLQLGGTTLLFPAIKRNATGIDFRLADDSAYTTITAQNIIANGVVRLKNYTVGTLPTGGQGDTTYVTDALTPSYLGIAVGGGAIVCKVFFNGTNWIT